MRAPRIVIDTNVFVAALLSRRGASHRLLKLIDSNEFQTFISTPLVLEYEDVALRMLEKTTLTEEELGIIIDYLCAAAHPQEIFYLWRPFLRDAKDDMVLELAVAARCDAIITFNLRHFEGAERFGIKILTPKQFLRQIGELP
jgi:putative PIN family toxin of toxin-antitoxin system